MTNHHHMIKLCTLLPPPSSFVVIVDVVVVVVFVFVVDDGGEKNKNYMNRHCGSGGGDGGDHGTASWYFQNWAITSIYCQILGAMEFLSGQTRLCMILLYPAILLSYYIDERIYRSTCW